MSNTKIPVYKITVPITSDELVLQVRGDQHYGIKNVDSDEMLAVLKPQQDKHRGNLFVVDTGDVVENHLTNSVGHGYDIAIKDPQVQIDTMRDVFTELNKHLYGEKEWANLHFTKTKLTGCRHVGVIGNHEYRTRRTAGLWVSRQIYDPSKTFNMDIQGIVKLKITNKKLKMSKEYTLFVAHRPKNSSSTSLDTILRNCRAKKSDIRADIYIYGHYHRRVLVPEPSYDDNGNFKKVLFAVNPSPITTAEYADWYGFSPLSTGWYMNLKLPIDPNKFCYGEV